VLSGEIGWTDSAAAATAMSTGYKTLNAYLGLDKEGNQLKNIRELAYEKGAKTGILTTDVITGGTPAGYLCHHTNRKDTEILQAQIDKITNDKKIDYIKGEVGNSLTDETRYALDVLSAGGSPFFIMIEEAQIDKMSEAHDYKGTIDAVKRFDDAILYAVEFTLCHPDTMLIVTADHETGELVPKITSEYKFEFKTYHHTNYNVPVYAMGSGCESITGALDNTDLAKISAKAFTDSPFGNND
jgi:alkaline phosphatase